jgi:nucleoside-diphosphate-sugar epimerase
MTFGHPERAPCHPERSEGSGSPEERHQIPRRCAPRDDKVVRDDSSVRDDSGGGNPLRALVTGGGGFLGLAIVERLLARSWLVRTFSRGDYPALRDAGVETICGDVADASAVRDACENCDIVFHVAGMAGIGGSRAEFTRINTLGTQFVARACYLHRVPRLIYTSSPSVIFHGTDLEGVDESVPYPTRHSSHYAASKAAAERIALSFNGQRNLRVIALRPHLIWGPGDNHIVPRLIARARAGKLRQVGSGRNKVDSTYIDNAADAHLLAADALENNPDAAGRAYFISNGESRPIWELINGILAAADLPPVQRKISHRAARMVGAGLEIVHELLSLKGEPRMTRFLADELATSHWFDISAARRQLGYEPRVSIDEGLRRLRNWIHETGAYAEQQPTAIP